MRLGQFHFLFGASSSVSKSRRNLDAHTAAGSRYARSLLLAGFTLIGLPLCSQGSSINTIPFWGGSSGITGIGADPRGDVTTVAQTFHANDPSGSVADISFLFEGYSSPFAKVPIQFQVGVSLWNSGRPAGSLLYLSQPLTASGNVFQTFTLQPANLTLAPGNEYALIFTTANFLSIDEQGTGSSFALVPGADYTQGQYFNSGGLNTGLGDLAAQNWFSSSANIAFSINFASSVPEPGTLLLGALATVSLLGVSRLAKPDPAPQR